MYKKVIELFFILVFVLLSSNTVLAFKGPSHAPNKENNGIKSQDIGEWRFFNDVCFLADGSLTGTPSAFNGPSYAPGENGTPSQDIGLWFNFNNLMNDINNCSNKAVSKGPNNAPNKNRGSSSQDIGEWRFFSDVCSLIDGSSTGNPSTSNGPKYAVGEGGTLSQDIGLWSNFVNFGNTINNCPKANCVQDGVTVAHGTSRYFYIYNSHSSCNSYRQSRTCNNGVLSGNSAYRYAGCSAPIVYNNCSLNGVTVPHGSGRYFYRYSSHSSCNSYRQYRTCNNGTLSGSSLYQYTSCSAPIVYNNCSLNGVTVAHGSGRYFYLYSSSNSCNSYRYYRVCNNGILSGNSAYQYAGCSAPIVYNNCSLNGVTVAHGSGRYFYRYSSHSSCNSYRQYRTCNNGTLSGSSLYQYTSCSAPIVYNNCSLNGVTVAHGSGRYFYRYNSHSSCNSYRQYRMCNNGTLSGSSLYQYASCSNVCISNCSGKSCGYDGCGGICGTCSSAQKPRCVSTIRGICGCSRHSDCSGYYNYCSFSSGEGVCITRYNNCNLNGATVAHGSGRYFYRYSSHSSCNSYRQYRTCNNGRLSGSSLYQYASCSAPVTYRNCSINGATVLHGTGRFFYSRTIDNNCNLWRQYRTCNNGTLSGSNTYRYVSCNKGRSCSLDGVTVPSGTGRYFYRYSTLTGVIQNLRSSTCDGTNSAYRVCINGTLNGSSLYRYSRCTARSCRTADGVTVPHGAKRFLYQHLKSYKCDLEKSYVTCFNGNFDGNQIKWYSRCRSW